MGVYRGLRRIARGATPPFIVSAARSGLSRVRGQRHEWEYCPAGWQQERTDPAIRGWNVEEVLKAYRDKWPWFAMRLQAAAPFALSPEAQHPDHTNLIAHNTLMSYAYALTLAAREKATLSMLDWGGGIGHYYALSRAMVPDLMIDYSCKDLPLLVEHGQSLFPEARFFADDSCLARRYDFVLASASLHYSQDWRATLTGLARATSGYLFVTRLPIVHRAASYVFVQRPYHYGYNTEYLGWCLNLEEFLAFTASIGMRLVREFLIGEQQYVHLAPEQMEFRGFLFHAPSDPAYSATEHR